MSVAVGTVATAQGHQHQMFERMLLYCFEDAVYDVARAALVTPKTGHCPPDPIPEQDRAPARTSTQGPDAPKTQVP